MANNDVAVKIKEEEKTKLTEQELVMEAERLASQNAKATSVIPEELLPPVVMKDKYGNDIGHVLIDGKYMPKPLADVFIQEQKVVAEYKKLDLLKLEEKHYNEVSKKSNK